MKRILFFTIVFSLFAFATDSTRTSIFKLPQFSAGSKLLAGTKSDSAQSNFSLNNGFYRLEAILSRQIDANGWFTSLRGPGTGNLDIASRGSHQYRITLSDSLYGYYNWQTEGSLLVQGNLYIGGTIQTDSIIVTGINGLILNPSDPSTQRGINFKSNDTTRWTLYTPTSHSFRFLNAAGANRFELTQTGDLTIVGTLSADTLIGSLVTDGITADSVQSPNVYTVIYSDTKIAGSSAGDTSANYTTFVNTTNGNETKVRLPYLHRRGTTKIQAFYQIKGTADAAVQGKLNLYTLAGVLVTSASANSTATSTYESTSVSLTVSGLTTNQLYELRFITSGGGATDIPTTTTVTILATSN